MEVCYVHLFPRNTTYANDTSRAIPTSMASGSPSHNEIPKYVWNTSKYSRNPSLGHGSDGIHTPSPLAANMYTNGPLAHRQCSGCSESYIALISHPASPHSFQLLSYIILHSKAEPKSVRTMKILIPRHLKKSTNN